MCILIQKLEKLDLGGNRIGDEGAIALANGLGRNEVNELFY